MKLEQTDEFKERKRKAYRKYVMDGLAVLPNYSFFHNSKHHQIFRWEQRESQRRYGVRIEKQLQFKG